MDWEKMATLGTFVVLLLTVTWNLHSELSEIKQTLKVLVERFEQVGELKKRVSRLEKKVFDLEDSDE